MSYYENLLTKMFCDFQLRVKSYAKRAFNRLKTPKLSKKKLTFPGFFEKKKG